MRLPILPLVFVSASVLSLAHAEPLVKSGDSVAFLGDSITQGGWQKAGGYVQLVKAGLAKNGIEITVIPAGISGNKSNDMLGRVNGILEKKPTWMTLSCGVNDVWHSKSGRGVELEDYKKNITEIVDRAEKAGTKVMLLTATLIGPKTDDELNTKAKPYNAFLRELAAQRNLPLADLSEDMIKAQGPDGKLATLTGDGVHMNFLGDQMMARGVLRSFGLNDEQLTAAVAQWQTLPDTVMIQPKVGLTAQQAAAMEAMAKAENKSVEAYLTDVASAAIKAKLDSVKPQ